MQFEWQRQELIKFTQSHEFVEGLKNFSIKKLR